MFLGVIADDFTGATDIAGFLVNNGLPTVQLNGVADVPLPESVQAVVISLKSRSCPAAEAVALSLDALRHCKRLGCSRFFFKYCSTFDSTEKGNIGPVTDAFLKELGQDCTVVCPALPVNGRTVYNGYLFVNGVPLDESGMRNHPLNPMRDANLMRLMDAQSAGKSGNVPVSVIAKGAGAVTECLASLKQQGVSYAVLDALADGDLDTLAEALADMPLVTGGSGLGGALARRYARSARSVGRAECATDLGLPTGGKTVLLSGSCSEMTNRQVAAYKEKGPFYPVAVERCMRDAEGYAREMADAIIAAPAANLPPLVSATVPPAELSAIQSRFGLASSHALETFFARLAVFLREAGYDHFIAAGGETSSVISQALMVKGFYIGPQIAPGVPWVRAIGEPLSLALKSGNFGDERFFFAALDLVPSR
ncbi:conserved hypothetical protein [uncultured delta proteobacterium]|uniref:3-oxo-tetronate kinase n=1 Tax=uncultured delta proteobacterium TaxID=34034 RepID=A0A212KF92_9DELT|nr:conserved hypothetical protein [uncultured delta proteobacterium]